jgi:sec-independent protein translocase protein TatC
MAETPPSPPEPENDLEEGRMAFTEHIRELRVRLRYAVMALAVGFAVSLKFSEEIFVILARPLLETWAKMQPENAALGESSFYFGGLIDPFWTYFSLAFWSGIFLSSPVIFYQVWKFIAPGLYKKERLWGVAFALASAVLFAGGAFFCYTMVLPAVCEFLLNYATDSLSVGGTEVALKPLLGMREYLDFAKKLLIGFGLIFELPLIIMVMALAGLVTHRSLWKFNRWATLLSFLVAAALTPPDIYSQLFMAGPLIVLYNISIVLAFFITTAKERKARKIDEADGDEKIDEPDGDEK